MIIGVPIPHNFFPAWEFAWCLIKISSKYSVYYAEGPYIYENRNRMIRYAKQMNDDLLMVDSDIIFTAEYAEKMAEHLQTLPAVTGVYHIAEGIPALFRRTENDYEYTSIPESLSVIGACGGGFLGMSRELIQKLPPQPCDNVFESSMHGEDISLCHRINEIAQLWCDPSIRLGHIRMKILQA